MAEVRESFPTTEDVNGVGTPLSNAVDVTTAAAALNGAVGFAFKDSSGNVILPQLSALGAIPVTEDSGPLKFAAGVLAAGSATMVLVTGATVALTVNKVSSQIKVTGSCYRDAVFEVIWNNNASETIIGKFRVGPGQFSYTWDGWKRLVTAGATGTQELKVKAQNINALSELSAEISFIESL